LEVIYRNEIQSSPTQAFKSSEAFNAISATELFPKYKLSSSLQFSDLMFSFQLGKAPRTNQTFYVDASFRKTYVESNEGER
jgi:hypothetical protein